MRWTVNEAEFSEVAHGRSERVRQLVVAGDLPGVRFGNAWAVPRDSIDVRLQVSNRRGRRLSARRAWESIAAGDVDPSNVSRYRNRGEVYRYEMSAADLAFVSRHDGALVSGAVAAIDFGELLQAEGAESDLYVSASLHGELRSLVAAVPDQLSGVVLRIVPDDVWSFVECVVVDQSDAGMSVAARAAAALDLMQSGDPRHWVAAENLIEARG